MRSGPVKPGLHWYTPALTFSVEFFGIHGPPLGPLHHASHTQSVMLPLPADEFELSGQAVHFAVPEEFLYVPAGHIEHCPLEAPVAGPVKPELHRHCTALKFATGVLFHAQQSCASIVPDSERYPAGHVWHDKAAVMFENVSAAHVRHGEESGVGLNEPGGQDVHSELFVLFSAYP